MICVDEPRRGVAQQAMAARRASGPSPAALASQHRAASVVLWGPGEQSLAEESSRRRAAPRCSAADVNRRSGGARPRRRAVGLGRHRSYAHRRGRGTPIVGIYGPTRPSRNGPGRPDDVTVSRTRLRVPSSAAMQAGDDVSGGHRGRGGDRRDRSPPWRERSRAEPGSGESFAVIARFRVTLGFALRRARVLARRADGRASSPWEPRSRSLARRSGSGPPATSTNRAR